MGKVPLKMQIFENFLFYSIWNIFFFRGNPVWLIFAPWVKSYEEFSIFWPFSIVATTIDKISSYIHISNWNLIFYSDLRKFFDFAYANFLKLIFLVIAWAKKIFNKKFELVIKFPIEWYIMIWGSYRSYRCFQYLLKIA